MITLGLSKIEVGEAALDGTMPTAMTKIGKVYKGTCRITQDEADITEHFEEGRAAPEVRKKTKKVPRFEFALMDADAEILADYIGGTATEGAWGYDGTEVVANKSIRLISEQGFNFEIPNADIEAFVDGDLSSEGIFLVNIVVTPLAVSSGKAISATPKA